MEIIDGLTDLYYESDFYNSCIDLLNAFSAGDKALVVNGCDVTSVMPPNMIVKHALSDLYWSYCRRFYTKTHKKYKYFAAACLCLCYYVQRYLGEKLMMQYDCKRLQFGFVDMDTWWRVKANPSHNWQYKYTFTIRNNKLNYR